MTITEIATKVVAEHSAVLIRLRSGGKGEVKQYDCKPMFTGRKHGWIALDAMTAQAIMAVRNALKNPDQVAKFDTIPLMRLVDFCWRMVA